MDVLRIPINLESTHAIYMILSLCENFRRLLPESLRGDDLHQREYDQVDAGEEEEVHLLEAVDEVGPAARQADDHPDQEELGQPGDEVADGGHRVPPLPELEHI